MCYEFIDWNVLQLVDLLKSFLFISIELGISPQSL